MQRSNLLICSVIKKIKNWAKRINFINFKESILIYNSVRAYFTKNKKALVKYY